MVCRATSLCQTYSRSQSWFHCPFPQPSQSQASFAKSMHNNIWLDKQEYQLICLSNKALPHCIAWREQTRSHHQCDKHPQNIKLGTMATKVEQKLPKLLTGTVQLTAGQQVLIYLPPVSTVAQDSRPSTSFMGNQLMSHCKTLQQTGLQFFSILFNMNTKSIAPNLWS